MARRKGKRSRKAAKKIPIIAIAGASVGTIGAIQEAKANGAEQGMRYFVMAYTGFDTKGDHAWNAGGVNLMNGAAPALIGAIGSKVASKVGLNRYLSAIPYLKF